MENLVIFIVGCVCGCIVGIILSAIAVAAGSVRTDHDELDDGVDEVMDNIERRIKNG